MVAAVIESLRGVVAVPRPGRRALKHAARQGFRHTPAAASSSPVICGRYLSAVGDDVMVGLGAIVVLGVGMQWLARRVRIPAILLLIGAGLVAGPWLGIIEPDEIFGDSLFTLVSMAVSLLLFEGGLGLDVRDLRRRGPRPVVQLVTLGVLITWVAVALVAAPLFGLPTNLCLLLGALLVVSGPTVVGPLLHVVRPREPTATILRWEGIVIDPIGATLALVVLKVVTADDAPFAELVLTALVGCAVGMVAAGLLVLALRTFSVPDDLEPAVTFMAVIAAYTVGEWILEEGGLFAATVLGVALANQRWVSVRRIAAFGHDVGVLVLGGLFVVLAARVTPSSFEGIIVPSIGLVAVLVLVVRPVVGWLCTTRLGPSGARPRVHRRARAPGIVAAATSALFALRLTDAGVDDGRIDAIVFLVIVGTCLVYGLGAAPLARALGVTEPEPDRHPPRRPPALAPRPRRPAGRARRGREGPRQRPAPPRRHGEGLAPPHHGRDRPPGPRRAAVRAHGRARLARRRAQRPPAHPLPRGARPPGDLRAPRRRRPRPGPPGAPGPRPRRPGRGRTDTAPAHPVSRWTPSPPPTRSRSSSPRATSRRSRPSWCRHRRAGGSDAPSRRACTQSSLAAAYDTGELRVITGPDVDRAGGEVALVAWRRDGRLDMAPHRHTRSARPRPSR